MLKRIMSLLFVLVFCTATPVKGAEAVYIDTETELIQLSRRVADGDSMQGVEVYLTASIGLTKAFTPIGNGETPFSGSFNGGGYTISGLRVERTESYNGLFGCIVGGSVKDLKVTNATVSGGDYSAVIAGRLYSYEGYSAITNCTVTGTVDGGCYTGGITGLTLSAAHGIYAESVVKECSFKGTVKGDIYVGGISGKAEAISTASRAESRIEGCVSNGSVKASGRYGSMAGGISGAVSAKSNGGSSIACVTEGLSCADSVTEKAAVGGISGAIGADGLGANAFIEKSVAFGSASAAALSGGIAGQCEQANDGSAAVRDCVAGGNVLGGDIYPIAKGEGISGCFSSEDKQIVYPLEAEAPVYQKGDINGDGAVDNIDAALVLKYDAALIILGIPSKQAADVNADSIADNADASIILKYDAGIIDGI